MKEKLPSVKHNMLMNVALTATSIIIPIITLPYVSRVLGPDYLGKVYFSSSIVAFFAMLAELGIPVYGVKACAKVRENRIELSRTVHEILTINMLSCACSYVLLILSIALIPKVQEERHIIIAMSGIVILNSMGMEWLYKAIEKYTYITVRSVTAKLIVLLLVFMTIKSSDDYIVYGVLTITAASASNILNMINAHKHVILKPMGGYNYKKHIPSMVFLFLLAAAVNIYTSMDIAVLDLLKGDAAAGAYGVAVKIKLALVSLITAIGAVILPRTTFYYKKGKEESLMNLLAKTMRVIVIVAVIIVVYFVVFANEIILVLSGPDFKAAVIPLQILMATLVVIVVSNNIGMQMLVPMDKEKEVAIAAVIGAIADLALNIMLIPIMSESGAAISTLISEVLVLVYLLKTSGRERVKALFSHINLLLTFSLPCLAIILCIWTKNIIDSHLLRLIVSALIYYSICVTVLFIGKKKMIYYTETKYWNREKLMNSLTKGRDDYFEMLKRMGAECIPIPVFRTRESLLLNERIVFNREVYKAWQQKLNNLGRGDTLIVHSPNSEKFYGFDYLIEKLRSRGCKIITIIFELETFFVNDYPRFAKLKRRTSIKIEKTLFDISDAIVVHNDVMKERLESVGVDGNKMFSVGVMDYLREDSLSSEATERISLDKPVAYAGNLSYEKSQFEYNLPEGFRCNLYGSDYTGPTNNDVCYKGVFDPVSLMDEMEGSFGLVWEGNSIDGCTGSYGDYLTFNNPHKIALYIASGMPVIVWSKAAMAHFVRRENCGLIVDSLREVPDKISSLQKDEYENMRMNACRVGNEMRQGVHIRAAVEAALNHVKKQALIVFTREPEPSVSKTRMMPYLSADQCAELQRCMLKDLALTTEKLYKNGTDIIVAYTGGNSFLKETFAGIACEHIEQRGDNLGDRMENAISDVMSMGYDRVVLIGSDVPDLDEESIEEAFELLDENDIVLGPTEDGGYYLIGMDEIHKEAFKLEHYGTGSVYEETLKALEEAGLAIAEADEYQDIDTPEDAAEYRSYMRDDADIRRTSTGRFLAEHAKISVIIPVYNEAFEIDRMMTQMNEYADECEIIFVDGKSTDGTAESIKEFINSSQSEDSRFILISSEKGRAAQMNRGAEASSGDILFFLHCDSTVPENFLTEIRRVMTSHEWGSFGVKFPSKNLFMLSNRIISNQRAWIRGLPFGDQGVFIDRELFFDMDMYPEQMIMEDYDFALMMRDEGYKPGLTRKRILTSDRRYGKGTRSILRTEFNMWKLRRMHRRGVSDELLKDMYEDVRVK